MSAPTDTMLATLRRVDAGWPLYSKLGKGYWFEPPGHAKPVHVRQHTMGGLMRRRLITGLCYNAKGGARRFRLTPDGRRALESA